MSRAVSYDEIYVELRVQARLFVYPQSYYGGRQLGSTYLEYECISA